MAKKGCCIDCVAPKRHPGCHDHCEERLKEVEEKKKRDEEIRKEKELDHQISKICSNGAKYNFFKKYRGR